MPRQQMLLRGAILVALLVPAMLAVIRPDLAWAAIEPASGAPPSVSPPSASPAIIAPDCPVGADQLSASGGLAVCVDRGEGATYLAGDHITVCVSANIPTIAIYPPPPPTVRVESMVGDGSSRVLLEDHFTEGNRCLTGIIAPPFGHEAVRARAIRADGTSFLEDTVAFMTQARS